MPNQLQNLMKYSLNYHYNSILILLKPVSGSSIESTRELLKVNTHCVAECLHMKCLQFLVDLLLPVMVPALKVAGLEELLVEADPVSLEAGGQLRPGVLQRAQEL